MGYFFGQKMIQKSLVYLCLFSSSVVYAENIDSMLQEYNQKNALSQKTIDENKGHLVLYTRERLERMNARTLKDVFKTTPIIYYNENRYGLPDPFASGGFNTYKSNYIRLYVDGVEITQGWMGSGVMLYGDINIDFVDHIEFYYLTPSLETTSNSAYLTIFLYSKDPKRDSGGKLDLAVGSRGYNSQSFSYGAQKEDFSYMINVSHTDAKRETIDNGTSTPLSRDFERTQLFSHIKTQDQFFHLQVIKKNTDSLAGFSWDATPLQSTMNYLNLHADYGIDLTENWHLQIAYDWLKTDMKQADDELPFPAPSLSWPDASGANIFNGEYKNSTYTGELTYKETIGDHRINAGIKGRYRTLDSFENFGNDALDSSFTSETIGTLFFQDRYVLSEKELLSFGVSYNYISRNGNVENDSLWQLRLGYIYSDENWSYKAYLYHSMFAIDPLQRYLYLSAYPAYENREPQKTLGITQEVGYSNNKHRISLLLHAMQDKDSLFEESPGFEGTETKYFSTFLNYDYKIDCNNEVNVRLYYAHYSDILVANKLEDISGYLGFFNRYESLDFYNGLVWHRNSVNWKNYFDWTASVSLEVNEELTLKLKGDNLLDQAKETRQYTFNPQPGYLEVSPIDQRIMIELEYMF